MWNIITTLWNIITQVMIMRRRRRNPTPAMYKVHGLRTLLQQHGDQVVHMRLNANFLGHEVAMNAVQDEGFGNEEAVDADEDGVIEEIGVENAAVGIGGVVMYHGNGIFNPLNQNLNQVNGNIEPIAHQGEAHQAEAQEVENMMQNVIGFFNEGNEINLPADGADAVNPHQAENGNQAENQAAHQENGVQEANGHLEVGVQANLNGLNGNEANGDVGDDDDVQDPQLVQANAAENVLQLNAELNAQLLAQALAQALPPGPGTGSADSMAGSAVTGDFI